MTTLALIDPPAAAPPAGPLVEVVVPVHNEQRVLQASITRLHRYLQAAFPFPFRITIADNASTDATWPLAQELAERLPRVATVHLDQKGRGRALLHVWSASDADVVAYTDVDLSTDLAALLPLVAPLVSGHSDLAIGTRLARGARTVRGPRRELISRGYNLLLRTTLRARFSDAQCGFKALRADAARALLPLIQDRNWFFDTELLVLAERAGLRIHEIPVDWVDDPDSRVAIVPTALEDLRGVIRLGAGLLTGSLRARLVAAVPASPRHRDLAGQLGRFAGIGVTSTIVYLALFMLLRDPPDTQAANLAALLATAVANTAANRRLTFGATGRRHAARDHAGGLAAFALGLALTSGALAGLHAVAAQPARWVELTTLVAANAAATLLRFVVLRSILHPPLGPVEQSATRPPPVPARPPRRPDDDQADRPMV
jgi:putative flippase GtrA/glycosyltransferase involved in cell wall biosynthesis